MQKVSGINNKQLNIVILSAPHPFKASGIVAFDLMQSFLNDNHNVLIITNSNLEKKYENTISIRSTLNLISNKLKKEIKRIFLNNIKTIPKYYISEDVFYNRSFNVKKIIRQLSFKPDAFIYLFDSSFLSVNELKELYMITKVPILWYMMDMAPFTGGCHYAWDCLGYLNKCGFCPGLKSKNENDLTRKYWHKKNLCINDSNIIPIAASEAQLLQLKKSSIYKNKPKYKVFLPINQSIFNNLDKKDCQNQLNLPTDKKIIFFGAVSLNEERKGYKELNMALEIFKLNLSDKEIDEIHLLIAGNKNENEAIENFQHSYIGYLDYRKLALAYNAAYVFACPSIEDSGPMMVNQSIICGTPVVSFDIGVSVDLVITGKTGYRAKLKDSNDFANGLNKIIKATNEEYLEICKNCLQKGIDIYGGNNTVNEFIRIIYSNSIMTQ